MKCDSIQSESKNDEITGLIRNLIYMGERPTILIVVQLSEMNNLCFITK